MKIGSSLTRCYPPESYARPKSAAVKAEEKRLYLTETLSGALQGAFEGSAGLLAAHGAYRGLPYAVLGGCYVGAIRGNYELFGAETGLSALRTGIYTAVGAAGGPKAGLIALAAGALVGAGLAAAHTRASLQEWPLPEPY